MSMICPRQNHFITNLHNTNFEPRLHRGPPPVDPLQWQIGSFSMDIRVDETSQFISFSHSLKGCREPYNPKYNPNVPASTP